MPTLVSSKSRFPIDADKANTPAYFEWALDRTRPGGLIAADNVVRDGTLAVADGDPS